MYTKYYRNIYEINVVSEFSWELLILIETSPWNFVGIPSGIPPGIYPEYLQLVFHWDSPGVAPEIFQGVPRENFPEIPLGIYLRGLQEITLEFSNVSRIWGISVGNYFKITPMITLEIHPGISLRTNFPGESS